VGGRESKLNPLRTTEHFLVGTTNTEREEKVTEGSRAVWGLGDVRVKTESSISKTRKNGRIDSSHLKGSVEGLAVVTELREHKIGVLARKTEK